MLGNLSLVPLIFPHKIPVFLDGVVINVLNDPWWKAGRNNFENFARRYWANKMNYSKVTSFSGENWSVGRTVEVYGSPIRRRVCGWRRGRVRSGHTTVAHGVAHGARAFVL